MKAALTLALMATKSLNHSNLKTLYDIAGSAQAIYDNRKDIRQLTPDASGSLVELFKGDLSDYEHKAEEEMEWCQKNNVDIRCIDDEDYPNRLAHCHDAPLVLFTRGKADLNATHIINIVGTRKCTPYGKDAITAIVNGLAKLIPDITIVSGLAYGIDINAHRAAMNNGLPTIGVVAHGQDMMYPSAHRKEANAMCIGNGAVVTEFFHGARPLAHNFLQRNRIIAGMSDATIVVESAAHGGGLVTARIAQDYGREVFAIPGPITAEMSAGTNNMIRDNKAALITSAQDILDLMMWLETASLENIRKGGIERSLFPDLSTDEKTIVDSLNKNGDSQINMIAMDTNLPVGTVTSLLFSLEMKGVVQPLSGNTYHLLPL